ncbi:hypothetical protein ACXR6G_06945 [Ancylomarina sp. YFZ004]
MNDDWKTNIGKFFAKHGTLRLKYLNDKLYTDSKEYNKYLEEFNGIRSELRAHEYIGEKSFQTVLKIHLDRIYEGRIMNAPFVIGLEFQDNGSLFMKYSTNYSWNAKIKSIVKNKEDEIEPYSYQEEELDEAEVYEKEYVFQLINQRLIGYVECVRNSRL